MVINSSRIVELEGVLRCFVGCAEYLSGELDEEHIVRLDPMRRRLTLFAVMDKGKAFPKTGRSITVDLKRQDVIVRDDPRLLVRKADVFGMAPRARQRSVEAAWRAESGTDNHRVLLRI